MIMIKKQKVADLFLLSVAFIWGITFTIVKDAIQQVDVFIFLFQRFLLAFLFFIPFVLYYKKDFSKSTITHGTLLGIMLFGGYAFQTIGLKYTLASNTGFITGLNVVLVPIINSIFFKKNIPTNSKIGSILAFLGLSLLCIGKGFYVNKGDIIVFFCAICVALHIIFTGQYTPYHNAFNLAFVQMGIICILSGIWASLSGYKYQLLTIHPNIIFTLIICSLFASNFAFWAQTYFQRFTTPTRTAIIFSAEPVFGALFAHVYGGEHLTVKGIIGGLLIFLGMIISDIRQT